MAPIRKAPKPQPAAPKRPLSAPRPAAAKHTTALRAQDRRELAKEFLASANGAKGTKGMPAAKAKAFAEMAANPAGPRELKAAIVAKAMKEMKATGDIWTEVKLPGGEFAQVRSVGRNTAELRIGKFRETFDMQGTAPKSVESWIHVDREPVFRQPEPDRYIAPPLPKGWVEKSSGMGYFPS
jgi:hypothetical protein